MDFEADIDQSIADLAGQRIKLGKGLTDREIDSIESRFGICFPPELRYFFQSALPLSPLFPDWRDELSGPLEKWMQRPTAGILFDVEHNDLWMADWGRRPRGIDEAVDKARAALAAAPRMIPIWGDSYIKYMPSASEAGLPVFSMRQSDIVHCGGDLGTFLRWLANVQEPKPEFTVFSADYREVPFWTRLTRQKTALGQDRVWRDLIPLMYPEYVELKQAAETAGGAADLIKEFGKYGVALRPSHLEQSRFYVAEYGAAWLIGLPGTHHDRLLAPSFDRAKEVAIKLLDALDGNTDADLRNILETQPDFTRP